jgi:GNAT superfamily N-acetyltransferase
LEMETDGTSMLLRDLHNMAVTGAFTNPDRRGNGVATLLLDAALRKAASLGMKSASVDFESRNVPALAFWTRHFTPFTFSVLRCVDGRLFRQA